MKTRAEVISDIERVTGQKASDEQRAVLEASGGKCILASAGSGKTTVLTWSLAVDIMTGAVDPTRLLCTTYSKAGANEMTQRLQALFSKLGLHSKVEVRTMHSAYYKVLRDFGIVKNVISNGVRSMYIREACRDAKLRLEDEDLETVDSLLSYQVNNLLDDNQLYNSYVFTLDNVSVEQYGQIRLGYSRRKQENGYIDFDDMQLYMYMLCCQQKNQDVLNYCHNMWQYFYVDEFQDISKIQFAILQALCTDSNKLLVIGDDDQCHPGNTKIYTTLPFDSSEPREPGWYGVSAELLHAGDKVLSYNGDAPGLFDIGRIKERGFLDALVELTTASGKKVRGTKEHVGLVRMPSDAGKYAVYLWCEDDVEQYSSKYHVGMGTTDKLEEQLHSLGADAAWVVSVHSEDEKELAQEVLGNAKKIVEDTGFNAAEYMTANGLVSSYPSYIGSSDVDRHRATMAITMFGVSPAISDDMKSESKHKLTVVYSTDVLKAAAEMVDVDGITVSGDTNGVSVLGYRHADINVLEQVGLLLNNAMKEIEPLLNLRVDRMMVVNKVCYREVDFGNIHPGMEVPVLEGNTYVPDVVTGKDWYMHKGYVYDISVPGSRCYVADGVLVHNCIYEWRGACPAIIQNICGYYDLQRFVLSTNYRCAGEIVKIAAVGIKNNGMRSEKSMIPYNQGGNIRIVHTPGSLYKMSMRAAEYIDYIVKEKGVNPSDIAVLARNNNHMSILSSLLMGMKYYTDAADNVKISHQAVFKDLKNVAIIADLTTSAEVVKNILWKLCSFVGASNSAAVGKFMRDTNCTVKQAVGYILNHVYGLDVDDGGLHVPVRVDAKLGAQVGGISPQGVESMVGFYNDLCIEDREERLTALIKLYSDAVGFMYKSGDRQRFLTGMCEYAIAKVEEDGASGLTSLIHLIEQTEQNTMIAPPGIGSITLSTMHGAKGREWRYVVLLADDNVAFPSFEGINKMLSRGVSEQDVSGSVDENRRLHYVAMTRAKEELAIFAFGYNLSVFTLEALSLLTKGDSVNNNHIISMAKNEGLTDGLLKSIGSEILTKSSRFYYNEPWGDDDWQEKIKLNAMLNEHEAGQGDGDGESGQSGPVAGTTGQASAQPVVTDAQERLEAELSKKEDTWGDSE